MTKVLFIIDFCYALWNVKHPIENIISFFHRNATHSIPTKTIDISHRL